MGSIYIIDNILTKILKILKIAHIDLNKNKLEFISYPEQIARDYIGGRGLGVYTFVKEIGMDVEPLTEENGLVFTIGPLVGTRFPTAVRTSLVSISPLTNSISTSNMGGRLGPSIRRANIDGLLITGKLLELSYLVFDGAEFSIHSAKHLSGKTVQETELKLREIHSGAIMTIGPAGENLVKYASITHNLENEFGRGGMGAIMGSKNLKAIIIDGDKSNKYEVHDAEGVKEYEKKLINLTKNHSIYEKYNKHGTKFYTRIYQESEGLGVDNYTRNQDSRMEALFEDKFLDFQTKHTACSGCVVACRHHYKIKDEIIKTPEFESIQLLGPNLGIYDPEIILPLTEYITNLGMDTISTGHILAIYKNILLKENESISTVELVDKYYLLLDEISLRSSTLGDELADGSTSYVRNNKLDHVVAQVKGMEFSAYAPRKIFGQGLGYGISSRGACHIRGGVSIGVEILKEPVSVNPKTWSGKGKLIGLNTVIISLIDSIGTCIHDFYVYIDLHLSIKYLPKAIKQPFISHTPSLFLPMLNCSPMVKAIKLINGTNYKRRELYDVGRRMLTLERLINNHRGFKTEDDFLPDKFYMEDTPENKALDKRKYARELKNYYKSMGWNEEGVPTAETIEALNLNEL